MRTTSCIRIFGWVLLLWGQALLAQSQDTFWVQQIGGTGDDQGNNICLDSEGNILLLGRFNNSLSIGSETITSNGSYDIFIAKFRSNGELLWVRTGGGPSSDRGYSVTTDSNDNVLITGAITGATTWDDLNATAIGGSNSDAFVAKYASDGTLLWIEHGGSAGNEQGYSVAAAPNGDVLLTGWFFGAGIFGSDTLKTYSGNETFVIRYRDDGSIRWLRMIEGADLDRAHAIAVDSEGGIFVAGHFTGTMFANGDTLQSNGSYDAFLVRLDSDGNILWARTFGGTGVDRAWGLTLDMDENPIVAGRFDNSISLDGQSATTNGDADAFIASFSRDGSLRWLTSGGGSNLDRARALDVDAQGDILVTGMFSRTATFGTIELSSLGGLDMFVLRLNPEGQVLWGRRAGGSTENEAEGVSLNDEGWGVAAGEQNDVFVTGLFRNSSQFGNEQLVSTGSNDVFLARYAEPARRGRIRSEVAQSAFVSDSFWVEIVVDSVMDLHATQFELTFSQDQYIGLAGSLAESVAPGEFLGDSLQFSAAFGESNRNIVFDLQRRDGDDGVSGQGVLARIRFVSSESTPFETEVDYFVRSRIASDPLGNLIDLRPMNSAIRLVGLPVWPGDTNNDGVVNQADMLPIGQFWSSGGATRPSANLVWAPQPAVPWPGMQATYADADGSGLVSQEDIYAIGFNWKRSRSSNQPFRHSGSATAHLAKQSRVLDYAFDVAPGRDEPGLWLATFEVPVAEGLFGLSLQLENPGLAGMKFDSFFASEAWQQGPLHIWRQNRETQDIELAITLRNGQQAIRGSARLVTFRLRAQNGEIVRPENLRLLSASGIDAEGNPVLFQATAAVASQDVPAQFKLHQNHPNPFNPETTIRFSLPEASQLHLEVFDQLGRRVRVLAKSAYDAGHHQIRWDGRNQAGESVATGIYWYRLTWKNGVQTRKMLLNR